LIDDIAAFRAKAKEVGTRLGPEILPDLPQRFHRPTPAPAGFTAAERGLAGWLSCWQFGIFEIIYQFREQALPLLRQVAFGEYDWTQSSAATLLCKLAAEGIERDSILAELRHEMPAMRDTALLYIAQDLLHQAKDNPPLAAILVELQQVPEFQEAVDELKENP
jgi:hypothetical protein